MLFRSQVCREHGADEFIDYSSEDLRERLRAITGGRGPDVIYDPVGGSYAEPAFRSIAWRGRYLVIGFANGEIPKLPLNLALLKGASIVGVFWGQYTQLEPAGFLADVNRMFEWIAQGRLNPHISARFALAEGARALEHLLARRATGKVEAIVGVSCLSVLERAFPYMEAAAIPGVAVPLLQDDCIDTTVDLDWVWDYIHLTSDDQTRRLDLGALRDEVDFWFSPVALDTIMGNAQGETERIARDWLMRAGKRWRPFLVVSAFQALRRDRKSTRLNSSH